VHLSYLRADNGDLPENYVPTPISRPKALTVFA